jgi:hypothetical protein
MLTTKLRTKAAGLCATRRIGAAVILSLLASCAHQPTSAPPAPSAVKPVTRQPTSTATVQQILPDRSPQQRYGAAVQLLEQGNTAQARAELVLLLQRRPGDRRAGQLLREIDTDPRSLYGADSFAYIVRPRDTLVSLARRYLGDAVNFYGLARFNNLTLPADLQPGQTVMIPGRVRSPERVAPPTRRAAPTAPQAAPARSEQAARPAAPRVDHGRAQRLRQQGLEQMSAGSIDRAVQLLSQAAVLDPTNGAIAGELARARRIQATIHSQ